MLAHKRLTDTVKFLYVAVILKKTSSTLGLGKSIEVASSSRGNGFCTDTMGASSLLRDQREIVLRDCVLANKKFPVNAITFLLDTWYPGSQNLFTSHLLLRTKFIQTSAPKIANRLLTSEMRLQLQVTSVRHNI